MRRLIAGTGWKMNIGAAAARAYAAALKEELAGLELAPLDLFVLPPFTTLHAAASAFADTSVAIGGQNMHWAENGAWTGEIAAEMLVEAGCRYVELAHSERLQHFGESYPQVRRKVTRAMQAGLTPIVCLGETALDKLQGRADAVLAEQVLTSIADVPDERVPEVVLAYEPRWAIGGNEAATPEYVATRHRALHEIIRHRCGKDVADRTRIIYGGAVTADNGAALIALPDVDGLFVGRAAWTPQGYARIVNLVHAAALQKAAHA